MTAADQPAGPKLTMRVYKATLDGVVTEERTPVRVYAGENTDVMALGSVFPPCACLRCRRQ